MKKILAIAWKDTKLRFSGVAEWLFFLIMPVFFTIVLAGGTGGPSDFDNRIRLVVVDQARTPLSQRMLAALEASDSVRPERLPLEEAEREFDERNVSVVLIIPAGFDLDRLQLDSMALELRQQPNNMNALIAERAVLAAVNRVGSTLRIARDSTAEAERIRPFAAQSARQAYFDAALQSAQDMMATAPDRLAVQVAVVEREDPVEYDPAANSSAGQMITWVFIPLIGISAMFAIERQQGTLRRILTTPTRQSVYLLGTIGGQVAAALVQMLLLVGFGVLVMGVNWGRSPLALGLVLLCSALAAAALGATMGAFVKTGGQANNLSIMLGMVMALLGGCWYPIELFPAFMQQAAKLLPTTWAMQAMLDLTLRGLGLPDILPEALVLLGFALVFFMIGVRRFRYE